MFYITLYIAKLINWMITTFSLGAGYTWPGHVALKLCSDTLSSKNIRFRRGVILISGTNGKTTTSKVLTHLLESSGLTVTHNKSGANLLNGIVSAILLDTDIFGNSVSDVGVFEVDEFTLPFVLDHLSPTILILLNLSRDQLDRYGEVDIIFDRWKASVSKLNKDSIVVFDETQEYFKEIPQIFEGRVFTFKDDPNLLHLTKLHGAFNIKNINAATLAATLLGLDPAVSERNLKTFSAAYGRGEIIKYDRKRFTIFLAKNPASFNQNLEILLSDEFEYDTLLFVLNDNIPDGRDVSWIYDVDPVKLEKVCVNKNIYVSGSRCLDMVIRLLYANVVAEEININSDIFSVRTKIEKDKHAGSIVALPNYSAMLLLRKALIGRSIL